MGNGAEGVQRFAAKGVEKPVRQAYPLWPRDQRVMKLTQKMCQTNSRSEAVAKPSVGLVLALEK